MKEILFSEPFTIPQLEQRVAFNWKHNSLSSGFHKEYWYFIYIYTYAGMQYLPQKIDPYGF